MTGVEVFLDEMPGETRGVVTRDGRFERLLVQRDDDIAVHRLGARVVGRVIQADPGFGGAFVDLGAGDPVGFLPNAATPVRDGDRIEVEIIAEPRGDKGPTLRRLGPAEGEARLLFPGPDVRERLATLAPGVPSVTGVDAIRASWEAEEEALADGGLFAEFGLDLALQRTRALVAVDIDYAHRSGRDARKGRARANREGLRQAARLIRLKRWGGLVAVDLVGAGLNGDAILADARAAFAPEGDRVAFGPLSRFGVLQAALPWGDRPIEEVLISSDPTVGLWTRALSIVRRLNHMRLSDPSVPRFVGICSEAEARLAAPLVERLGPRTRVRAEPGMAPGQARFEEG